MLYSSFCWSGTTARSPSENTYSLSTAPGTSLRHCTGVMFAAPGTALRHCTGVMSVAPGTAISIVQV